MKAGIHQEKEGIGLGGAALILQAKFQTISISFDHIIWYLSQAFNIGSTCGENNDLD